MLADFVAVEQPSGFIEGQYARVTATLCASRSIRTRSTSSPHGSSTKAWTISRDFVTSAWFCASTLRSRHLTSAQYPGRTGDPAVKDALDLYRTIVAELTTAYSTGRVEERAAIVQARDAMTKLNTVADGLGGKGVGIPFFQPPPPK